MISFYDTYQISSKQIPLSKFGTHNVTPIIEGRGSCRNLQIDTNQHVNDRRSPFSIVASWPTGNHRHLRTLLLVMGKGNCVLFQA